MKRAFTLIEIIATLALLSIASVLAGKMLSANVARYQVETVAAASAQKIEVAMLRIVDELGWADPTTVRTLAQNRTIEWESQHPSRRDEGTRTLSWSGTVGDDLFLDGIPILDEIESFRLFGGLAPGAVVISLKTRSLATNQMTYIYFKEEFIE